MLSVGITDYNTLPMATQEDRLAVARQRMLTEHLRGRGIADPHILAAFAAIPRERFVQPQDVGRAYEDYPLPIGDNQTISQPYIVAEMVQQLNVKPHHRILDIGAGSGYQTAILARMVEHVYAVERIEQLADRGAALLADLGITNVTFTVHDGSRGWAERAPFDGIIAGAAAPKIPAVWQEQIVDGGRIVAPVGPVYSQELVTIERCGDRWDRHSVCGVRFVPLIGEHAWPEA